MKYHILRGTVALLFTALLCTCGPAHPEPIVYGKDQCAFCRMAIVDVNFGSELVTDKGRVMKYDAAECMANQLAKEDLAAAALYAVPYDQPNSLLPVDSLTFLIDPEYRSPMGANLVAFSPSAAGPYRGRGLTWEEVVQKLTQ